MQHDSPETQAPVVMKQFPFLWSSLAQFQIPAALHPSPTSLRAYTATELSQDPGEKGNTRTMKIGSQVPFPPPVFSGREAQGSRGVQRERHGEDGQMGCKDISHKSASL